MRLSHAPRLVGSIGLRKVVALTASAFLALVPVLQAGPPTPPAGSGTIKGKLVWAAGPVPAVKIDVAKDDPKVKDAICKVKPILNMDLTVDPATKGVANAFAYLVSPTGDFSAVEKELIEKTPQVVVDQINCEYIPSATVVHKDQKLTFKSSDPVGHNVDFKPFANGAINPMLPPNGKVDYRITKAEKRPPKCVLGLQHSSLDGWLRPDHRPPVRGRDQGRRIIRDRRGSRREAAAHRLAVDQGLRHRGCRPWDDRHRP